METGSRHVGPAVAGSWYPSDPAQLAREVDDLLERGPTPSPTPPPLALIEPHAGYVYSGRVAASGFRRLRGARLRRVVLLGPSHYAGFRGAALPDADGYRTPLGDVPLDRKSIDALTPRPGFRLSNEPFEPEHSLEAEIPFLQRALDPGWKLVPLLIGGGSVGEILDRVADGLRPILDAETAVVVSSDFTHYGTRFGYVPFTERVPERIRQLDMGAIDRIREGDGAGFESYVTRTGATICGQAAIAVLLRALPDGTRAELVDYDTSGAITGDWAHTVSYAALAFPRKDAGR